MACQDKALTPQGVFLFEHNSNNSKDWPWNQGLISPSRQVDKIPSLWYFLFMSNPENTLQGEDDETIANVSQFSGLQVEFDEPFDEIGEGSTLTLWANNLHKDQPSDGAAFKVKVVEVRESGLLAAQELRLKLVTAKILRATTRYAGTVEDDQGYGALSDAGHSFFVDSYLGR